MTQGLIVKAVAGDITLSVDGRLVTVRQAGKFRALEVAPRAGDTGYLDSENRLVGLAPRKNVFSRPFMANLDTLFLVFSVADPALNLNLLDRLLAVACYHDVRPVILFSKLDLLTDEASFRTIESYYRDRLGIPVYETRSDEEKEAARAMMTKEIGTGLCAFAGQSGVGKTTLLNLLTGSHRATQETSQALGRGKCTTRHVELVPFDRGYLADTPGFGTLALDQPDVLSLSLSFPDFHESACSCHYPHCLHLSEPHCAVREAASSGKILPSRYQDYVALAEELAQQIKNRY